MTGTPSQASSPVSASTGDVSASAAVPQSLSSVAIPLIPAKLWIAIKNECVIHCYHFSLFNVFPVSSFLVCCFLSFIKHVYIKFGLDWVGDIPNCV